MWPQHVQQQTGPFQPEGVAWTPSPSESDSRAASQAGSLARGTAQPLAHQAGPAWRCRARCPSLGRPPGAAPARGSLGAPAARSRAHGLRALAASAFMNSLLPEGVLSRLLTTRASGALCSLPRTGGALDGLCAYAAPSDRAPGFCCPDTGSKPAPRARLDSALAGPCHSAGACTGARLSWRAVPRAAFGAASPAAGGSDEEPGQPGTRQDEATPHLWPLR